MSQNVVLVVGSKGVGKSHVVSRVTGSEVSEEKSELVSSFTWEISTKYYTAPLNFVEARVTAEWSHEALSKEHTSVEDTKALIFVVDLYEKEPEALVSKWSDFIEARDLDVALLVGNRARTRPEDPGVAKLGDDNAERLQDFARDNYLEFVEVPFTDGQEAAPVDKVASMLRERVGTERVHEALACNHWSDMTMHPRDSRGKAIPTQKKSDKEDGSTSTSAPETSKKKINGVPSEVPSLLSKGETKAGQDAAKLKKNSNRNDETTEKSEPDVAEVFAGMGFIDDFGVPSNDEFPNLDDEDEGSMFANIERFESVFEKMRAVREQAQHMSHEARRKLAEDTILEMCSYLNIDDESGDDGQAAAAYEQVLDGEDSDTP